MAILTDPSTWLYLPMLVSMIVIFIIVTLDRLLNNRLAFRRWLIDAVSFLGVLILAVFVGLLTQNYLETSTTFTAWTASTPLVLRVDSMSLFFIILATIVFSIIILFTIFYESDVNTRGIYFSLLYSIYAGIIAVVSVGDFFSLFIVWEIVALASYALVTYHRQEKIALEAGFKYLIMSSFGSLSFLYGFSIIYGEVGTLSFTGLASLTMPTDFLHYFALICIVIGFGVTCGIIFLNAWLPDAYQVPPIYPALSSGVIVYLGIYGLFRAGELLFPIKILSANYLGSNFSWILLILGLITASEGNLLLLAQFTRPRHDKDIKRILAYSTIVSLGFVVTALGVGGTLGLASALFYALNDALIKIMLFFLVGYIYLQTNSRDLDSLTGIGRKNIYISIIAGIGLLAIGGLPFTGGFIAKLLIILALANTLSVLGTITIILVAIMILNAAVAFIAMLWFIRYLITLEVPISKEIVTQGSTGTELKLMKLSFLRSWPMQAIIGILAIVVLLFGIIPGPVIDIIGSMI